MKAVTAVLLIVALGLAILALTITFATLFDGFCEARLCGLLEHIPVAPV